jgi:hypothetical protein
VRRSRQALVQHPHHGEVFMNMRRVLIGTVVVGIVANVIDYVLYTYLIGSWYSSLPFMNPNPPMLWLIIGDFAAAFMLSAAWDKVGAAFGRGSGAGFRFGLAAGAFVTFPAYLFWQMQTTGFPYALAWKTIIVGVLGYGVLGWVLGMLDGKQA